MPPTAATFAAKLASAAASTAGDLVLKNVFRNSSHGTFGEVAVMNGTASGELEPSFNLTSDYDLDLDPPFAPPNAVEGGDCVNGTRMDIEPTILSEIPAKEIIIVCLMLALWIYSSC